MTRTNDILGQIDDAVSDWTVSADAMRSQPADARGGEPTIQVWDEALAWATAERVREVSQIFTACMQHMATMGGPALAEAMRGFAALVKSTHTPQQTRRTVQVATRKYRARRKR